MYLFPKVIFVMTGSGYFVFYFHRSDFKNFFRKWFFSYIHDWKWLLIDLFISQSDVFYTSESDYLFISENNFLWQEVVILFFTQPEVILKLFRKSFFIIHRRKWLFVYLFMYLFISQSDFCYDRKWLFCFLLSKEVIL